MIWIHETTIWIFDTVYKSYIKLKKNNFSILSFDECGRQRTSWKFHDLVLSLRSQNSRVPETIVFQALFSQRKVSVFFWFAQKIKTYLYFFAELLNLFKNSTGPHMRSCFLRFYAFNCKSSSISARVLAWEMAPRSLAAPEVPRR